MQKILVAVVLTYVCFVLENITTQVIGPWFHPNFLLILVVFFNLIRGIRYSILTALAAGFLKDSFGAGPFGINTFSFVLCAYLTTYIKMYVYQMGSGGSRMALVLLINVIFILVHYVLVTLFMTVDLKEILTFILVPEILATVVMTNFIMGKLKLCVSKLFV